MFELDRRTGIRILDHVIAGDGEYASFKEQGLL